MNSHDFTTHGGRPRQNTQEGSDAWQLVDGSIPLDTDRPRGDPRDDRLGYAGFAHHVARAIVNVRSGGTVFFAVHGEWGTGKSTFLNFVRFYIERESPQGTVHVIPLNPWWFTGEDGLAAGFLAELASALSAGAEDDSTERFLLALMHRLVGLHPANKAGQAIGEAAIEAAQSKSDASQKPKSTQALHRNIEQALRDRTGTVVVFIDDLDRLSTSELNLVFKLLKGIGDLPGTRFVLSFDRAAVASALSLQYPGRGEQFIEKIVQVPFSLPGIESTRLTEWLREELVQISSDRIADTDLALLRGVVRTPRDLVRFVASLRITYPIVKEEVQFSDFSAMEAIRLFEPALHDLIGRSTEMFAGLPIPGHFRLKECRQFHDAWVDGIPAPRQKAIRLLVANLFPKVAIAWQMRNRVPDEEAEQIATSSRAASLSRLHHYFAFSISPNAMTRTQFDAILKRANSQADMFSVLAQLNDQPGESGSSKFGDFLDRLDSYPKKQIPADAVEAISIAILQCLSAAPKDAKTEALGYRQVVELLHDCSRPHRHRILALLVDLDIRPRVYKALRESIPRSRNAPPEMKDVALDVERATIRAISKLSTDWKMIDSLDFEPFLRLVRDVQTKAAAETIVLDWARNPQAAPALAMRVLKELEPEPVDPITPTPGVRDTPPTPGVRRTVRIRSRAPWGLDPKPLAGALAEGNKGLTGAGAELVKKAILELERENEPVYSILIKSSDQTPRAL